MAKKNRGFTWVREDISEEPLAPSQRRDIHEERALKASLKSLAQRLVAVKPEHRVRLPLDAELLAAVEVLAVQGPKSSRRRQLLRVQRLLRERDLEQVEAALQGDDSGDPGHRPEVLAWQQRLHDQGDDAIQAFMAAHPDADRQQLRALTRQTHGKGKAADRAKNSLLQIIEETLHPTW
jgi:ribosome-associated protein